MIEQFSFTDFQRNILPGYKNTVDAAGSMEEIIGHFNDTSGQLFDLIFQDQFVTEDGDIAFMPEGAPPYVLNQRLLGSEVFFYAWKGTDLPLMITFLANLAKQRYTSIAKGKFG